MRLDVIRLTKSYPKATILIRRVRAMVTGKPYFFNRQRMRRRVFDMINAAVPFGNYIETGTYLGVTTHFLAATAKMRGAQVHSCEISDDYFAIATSTVGGLDNVRLHHGNSVDFLRDLSPEVSRSVNFVYLDAHWDDYLPLRDELSIISGWPQTIVMIDDFRVPDDEGFGWDFYDGDRQICMRYIDGSFGDHPVFVPSYPARAEGESMARGYCVIAMSDGLEKILDGIELLRNLDN